MPMLKRFRRSLKLEKNKDTSTNFSVPESPFCHSCGQMTPQASTFDGEMTPQGNTFSIPYTSFSSTGEDELSYWKSSQRSDSGYGSFSNGSQTSESQAEEDNNSSIFSFSAPTRQSTYSSSIYSNDNDESSPTEPFPTLPVIVQEPEYDTLNLPLRKLSDSSEKAKPRSKYARLNDLPVASPRALAFPNDVFDDFSAGIEEGESAKARTLRKKRSKWGGSLVILPSQLRRLSLGKKENDVY